MGLSTYLLFHLHFSIYIYLLVYLHIHPSIHPVTHLPIYVTVYPSIRPSLSIHLLNRSPIRLSISNLSSLPAIQPLSTQLFILTPASIHLIYFEKSNIVFLTPNSTWQEQGIR